MVTVKLDLIPDMEIFELNDGEVANHRVKQDGVWYYKDGDVGTPIPLHILKAERLKAEEEEAARLAEKGHDCSDFVIHYELDRGLGNGSFFDVYDCGKCGENLQVG